MKHFFIIILNKNITNLDLLGLVIGHVIFAIALTQLIDWTWLKNLMTEEDKIKMLKSYTWKDLLVDGAILAVFIGIIFVITSLFL